MKFVAIDLETTGLDESYCQILEFGAIAWEIGKGQIGKPFVRRFIYDKIVGEPIALAMNAKIIKEIVEKHPGFSSLSTYAFIGQPDSSDASYGKVGSIFTDFQHWLQRTISFRFGDKSKEKITIAGKNFGSFDSKFLHALDYGRKWMADISHHRYLDPGNLYFNPKTDDTLPSTKVCMERAGLNPNNYELHTTLGDCRLVCDLIENYYR